MLFNCYALVSSHACYTSIFKHGLIGLDVENYSQKIQKMSDICYVICWLTDANILLKYAWSKVVILTLMQYSAEPSN